MSRKSKGVLVLMLWRLQRLVCCAMVVLLLPGATTQPMDVEVVPHPFVVASPNGKHYFKMWPTAHSGGGVGVAYSVAALGKQDPVLWKVQGWFAFEAHLSGDGRDLVRVGASSVGRMQQRGFPADHVALTFYHDGIEVARYSAGDLLRNAGALIPSSSGWIWRSLDEEVRLRFKGGRWLFSIATSDGVRHTFECHSGRLLEQ